MRKQRGQSAVEFALVAPMIFLMVFGAVYGGIMFLQFMDCSNAARTIAREVAVTSSTPTAGDKSPREKLFESYNNKKELGAVGLYNIERYVYLLDEAGERITAPSEDTSGDSSESTPGDSSESTPGDSSESTPENSSESTPGDSSEDTSGASSGGTSEGNWEQKHPPIYDRNAKQVEVLFLFDHGQEFLFGFPPRYFAASYRMALEDN
ncbi:MAG: pilus assembly protein [Quinella sp. 1Q5]|nr:pilus assembly protein [Quinella sp. 1Q5]